MRSCSGRVVRRDVLEQAEHRVVGIENISASRASSSGTAVVHDVDPISVDLDLSGRRKFELDVVVAPQPPSLVHSVRVSRAHRPRQCHRYG